MTTSKQPTIVNLTGISAEQLYAEAQCNCHSVDKAILITDFGLAIMVGAWPVSVNVSEDNQSLTGIHRFNKSTTWENYDSGKYAESYAVAVNIINSK